MTARDEASVALPRSSRPTGPSPRTRAAWWPAPRTLRVLGGVAVLAVLAREVGSDPFVAALHRVSAASLLGALAIGVATTVLSAWRWLVVARGLGLRLSLRGAVGDYYRALFLNGVLPAGVLGDVHRAVRHGRDVGDVGRAATAVVVERAAGQAVLVVAVVGAFLLAPEAVPLPAAVGSGAGPARAAVTVVVVAGIAATVLAMRAGRSGRLAGRLDGRRPGAVPGGRPGPLAALVRDARTALVRPGVRTAVLGTSAAVLAGHVATFLLAARTAGTTASVGRLVPLLLLALLAMALPLNVGGWGPREGATAWAFAAVGLGAGQGVTVAVVYGLLVLVASLPGAAVLVARRIGDGRVDRPADGPAVARAPAARTLLPSPVPVPRVTTW